MVIKTNKSLLGEDWFQSFCNFRINPETFLDKRKLTRDAFCLDVLKELYLDYIEIQNKTHLLLLLQEYSSLLIKDANLLEQVVGSLVNLYDILGTKPEKRLLKCQILVTIVTILLSHNLNHDFSRLITKVKSLLIDIIYNSSEDSTVISTGCQCLEEIEVCYPGSLKSELGNLLTASEKETSPTFQSYTLLLSVCMRNILTKHHKENSSLQQTISIGHKNFLVFSLVTHLLDMIPYMTYTAMYRVLKDLIFVIKHSPTLSSMVFKLYIQNIMMSSDLPLLHLTFDLLEVFGEELVTAQEEANFFMQIMKMSTHPCLTASHRLIFLDWLKSCTLNKEIPHHSNLRVILPAPFDGPLTQEKKSYVLCLSIPGNSEESSAGNFLNECINGLVKCSLLSGGTKSAPSLFRTLFLYFYSHKSEFMHNAMYKLLIGIMKTSPHLTPYALSFLKAVKIKCPDSQFHQRILEHLVEHILSIPIKQFFSNLEYYLCILEIASQEHASLCRPRAVLRLFQKLLSNTEFEFKNIWSTGNDILSVCRTILKYHDVQIFYCDLAEVLSLVTQNFDDADVKDRAKIYYTMLTSLSKSKVQTIFNLQSSVKDSKNALNNFVAGGDSSQFTCIQKLSKPILKLTRFDKNSETSTQESYKTDTSSVCTDIPDVLESYQSYLSTHEPTLKLQFLLKHINSADNNFSDLYSIVIKTHSEPASKEISVIEIPVLKNFKAKENEGKVIVLSLKPEEPYPLILHFKSEFTCDRGYNYTCHLPSIALKFEDLFMPLPVPQSAKSSTELWRQKLFDDLWNKFKEKIDSREIGSTYCQSLFCVKTGKVFFSVVEQKWKSFIVYKETKDSYNIAICLLPENHILMKMSVVNDKPFVNIIVDKNKILPWITVCLQDMSANL
ncbi:hypothetical protein JTE90_014167 [Oedothorax gibbosus]|uniref:AP-5 complex subunit beta-1 n=1 Tax=Oedothorax gibbosus TaxID=931172 RepID=A0AAV6VJ39_9ARAC|nr:hypothetical protein JTE90_014167 [Oedothorax gibbosus]